MSIHQQPSPPENKCQAIWAKNLWRALLRSFRLTQSFRNEYFLLAYQILSVNIVFRIHLKKQLTTADLSHKKTAIPLQMFLHSVINIHSDESNLWSNALKYKLGAFPMNFLYLPCTFQFQSYISTELTHKRVNEEHMAWICMTTVTADDLTIVTLANEAI